VSREGLSDDKSRSLVLGGKKKLRLLEKEAAPGKKEQVIARQKEREGSKLPHGRHNSIQGGVKDVRERGKNGNARE